MEIEAIRSELLIKVKKIDPIGKRLKFRLDEHVVVVDGTGEENHVHGDDLEADCTITMSKETYVKLQQKKMKPMIATLTGKIKVKGDIATAQKLKQLM